MHLHCCCDYLNHLHAICKAFCPTVYAIEHMDNLANHFLKVRNRIGIVNSVFEVIHPPEQRNGSIYFWFGGIWSIICR